MDYELFKTSVDNMYTNKKLDITNPVFNQIFQFLDDYKDIKEIVGHQENLFFVKEKDYFKDYFLKRTLQGSAIDEKNKQLLGLQLSKLLIEKYYQNLDFDKVFSFVLKNVSFQAALNKTERKFFVYSFIFLCVQILQYTDNEQLINSVNIQIIKVLSKNQLFKIQLCEALDKSKLSLNKIQKILEFSENLNLQQNYENFILVSQIYLLFHNQMKNQQIKTLKNKIQQCIKVKFFTKILDEIFEDQNLKGQESNSIVFKVLALILGSMQHLDLLIHIFNLQKEKAQKTKNKQRLFNNIFFIIMDLMTVEGLELKRSCVNDEQLLDIVEIVLYYFEEHLIKKIKGVSQLQAITATEKTLDTFSQVQNYNLAQKIIHQKKFIQIPSNLKMKIFSQLNENELVQLVKELLEQKKQNYQQQNFKHYKNSLLNILNFVNYIKNEQVFTIVFVKITKIYVNAKKIIQNFKELLLDQSLDKSVFEFQTFLYSHLSETLFQIKSFKTLNTCLKKWVELLKIEQMDQFFQLAEKTRKKNDNLGCLLLCLGFQNHLTEQKDYQTVIFNQSFQDFQIFCENFCEEDVLENSDYEILVDCIISLMAVQNKNLRNLILQVFKGFVSNFDLNILTSIEQELFRPLKSSLYNEEGDLDMEDQLEFDEDQEDIVIG